MDYAAPAAVGGSRWRTFVRVLAKLFLLKEWRERIISHLLSIRFTHNGAAGSARRAPLPFVARRWPPFFFFLFKVKAFDAAPPFAAAAVEFGVFVCLFIYLPALRRAAFVRPPPRSRSAERERLNILFDGLEPERF